MSGTSIDTERMTWDLLLVRVNNLFKKLMIEDRDSLSNFLIVDRRREVPIGLDSLFYDQGPTGLGKISTLTNLTTPFVVGSGLLGGEQIPTSQRDCQTAEEISKPENRRVLPKDGESLMRLYYSARVQYLLQLLAGSNTSNKF